jgi:hypothetical protein
MIDETLELDAELPAIPQSGRKCHSTPTIAVGPSELEPVGVVFERIRISALSVAHVEKPESQPFIGSQLRRGETRLLRGVRFVGMGPVWQRQDPRSPERLEPRRYGSTSLRGCMAQDASRQSADVSANEMDDGRLSIPDRVLLVVPPVLLVASGWFMIAAAVWLTSSRDALTIVGGGLVLIGAFASRASGPVSLGPEGIKFVLGALVPRAAGKAVEKAQKLGYPPEQVAAASAAAATTAAATAPAVLPELALPTETRRQSLFTSDWRAWSGLRYQSTSHIDIDWVDQLADEIATQAVDAINPARAGESPEADGSTRRRD